MVVGPAPQGHPELCQAHAEAVAAMEIPTEDAMVYAMTRGDLEATQAHYERIAQHAPPEVSAELKAEHTAKLEAQARGAELEASGQREAGQAWQTRADAADVRATEREGQAERYSVWEAEHRAERELAEAARAELARRDAAERQAAQASAPQEPEVKDPAPQEPEVAEPDELEPNVQEAEELEPEVLEPVVEEVTADSIGDEFPQVTTGAPAEEPRPIADPELARAAAELDAHQAERQEAADARAAGLADRQEARATREASREYEGSQPSAQAESPSAWVAGPDTPSYGGPEATTAEPSPAAEAEAGL